MYYTTEYGFIAADPACTTEKWRIKGISLNETISLLLEFGDPEVKLAYNLASAFPPYGSYFFSRKLGFWYS